ncbi:FxSxx-COOH system tetratricopeptide repeat protein [Nonomuraea dietziae]|uniref:FxSxx-COOH system tetratricopeptide repeat protein n=1 Tax=Nonomuraea dietziae TaxID=65515 RepID=UPI003606170C
MTRSAQRASKPARRRRPRVLAWTAGAVVSLALLVAGAAVFFADPQQGPTVVEDVLDKRASVVSMFVGVAGLLVAGAALLAQLRSSAASAPGGASSSGPASPAVGTLSGGMVVGQAVGSARVSGPGSTTAEGARALAVGGDSWGPVMTGDGAIAVTGQVGVLGGVHLPPRAEVASRPIRLAPRPPQLSGRDEILAGLRQRLVTSDRLPSVVTVHGLGGVGKTSLVLEYAHRYLHEYDLVWQIPAEDPTVASAALTELAALLGVRDVGDKANPVDQVHAILAARNEPWLLIFDDAPDMAAVHPLLAPTGPGHILITSRASAWPSRHSLELPVLSIEAATAFLLERTGHDDAASAAEIVKELGALPLALEQAGAYLSETGISPDAYLNLLRTQRAQVLTQGQPWGYRERVASTWQLASAQLADTDPHAVALLRLLSCYAPDAIPYQLLLDEIDPTGDDGPNELPYGELAVNAAVTALRRYSLVGRPANGMISIHRLVQAITLDQLSTRQRERWYEKAAALLESAISDHDPAFPPDWPRFAQLLSHVRAVLPADSPGLRSTARYLGLSGDYRTAVLLSQEITEHLTASLGPEHPDTLVARHTRARWTGDAGDAAAARDQLRDLLPVRERVLGADHPDTLTTRHELAHWTGRAGDAAAARDQLRDLLPIHERVQGSEHPDTLTTRHTLAHWTGRAGDAVAARDQFRELLPIRQRVLGPEHPDTLAARHTLARWTGDAGDPVGARDQFHELLPIRQRVQGPEHPDTLTVRHDLAWWTGEAGDAAAARDQLRDLLPVRERVQGPEHPYTLTIRHTLARWTGRAGRGRRSRPASRPAARPRARPGCRASRHPDRPARPRPLDG